MHSCRYDVWRMGIATHARKHSDGEWEWVSRRRNHCRDSMEQGAIREGARERPVADPDIGVCLKLQAANYSFQVRYVFMYLCTYSLQGIFLFTAILPVSAPLHRCIQCIFIISTTQSRSARFNSRTDYFHNYLFGGRRCSKVIMPQ